MGNSPAWANAPAGRGKREAGLKHARSSSNPSAPVHTYGVASYSYDALDRVTQILYGGATSCGSRSTCTTLNYDPDGNLSSQIDNTGTTSFSYDTMNRLTKKTLPDTSSACSGQGGLTFAYDDVGNLCLGPIHSGCVLRRLSGSDIWLQRLRLESASTPWSGPDEY